MNRRGFLNSALAGLAAMLGAAVAALMPPRSVSGAALILPDGHPPMPELTDCHTTCDQCGHVGHGSAELWYGIGPSGFGDVGHSFCSAGCVAAWQAEYVPVRVRAGGPWVEGVDYVRMHPKDATVVLRHLAVKARMEMAIQNNTTATAQVTHGLRRGL